jgi:hypothetical protein
MSFLTISSGERLQGGLLTIEYHRERPLLAYMQVPGLQRLDRQILS